MSKQAFNFDLDSLKSNSSKNLEYNSLYAFYAKQNKVELLSTQQKKNIRKVMQNTLPSDMPKSFIASMVQSNFFTENKSKEKFAPYVQLCEQMQESIKKQK